MRKAHIVLLCLCINIQVQAFDWGKTGHRTTGEIAEKYLTKKAKKALDELLDGPHLPL